jgi:hypothetical protein
MASRKRLVSWSSRDRSSINAIAASLVRAPAAETFHLASVHGRSVIEHLFGETREAGRD